MIILICKCNVLPFGDITRDLINGHVTVYNGITPACIVL